MGSELYDGTQPPPPPQLFPDPMAGLITGENIAGSTPFDSFGDDLTAQIAEPVDLQVDDEAIQAMVNSAMSEDLGERPAGSKRRLAPAEPIAHGDPFLPSGGQRPPVPALPGMMPPQQRQRPTGQLVRQALRSYPRNSQPQLARPQRRPKSSGASGVIVAVILIVVFVLIALQVISGILDTLTN